MKILEIFAATALSVGIVCMVGVVVIEVIKDILESPTVFSIGFVIACLGFLTAFLIDLFE